MKETIRTLTLASIVALLVTPASAQFSGLLKRDTEKTNESEEARERLPEYTGIKHAVGVTDFENQANWHSQWELGRNLAAMLESALFDSGRFVIVERQELGDVLREQDLQSSGRAAQSTEVAQTGLIRSARYIATGDVTRVDANTQSDSGGVRVGGFRIGGGSNKAEIELVVKLIDTTSSQVVASQRISGKAGGNRLSLGYSRGRFGGNLDNFAKTPIGEAAQDCISQAVEWIAVEMEDYEVTANVVIAQSEKLIVINRGTNYGFDTGMQFVVRTTGETLTDPATGEILAVLEGEVTGRIEITRVDEKVSYCKLVDGELPERGDTVVVQ